MSVLGSFDLSVTKAGKTARVTGNIVYVGVIENIRSSRTSSDVYHYYRTTCNLGFGLADTVAIKESGDDFYLKVGLSAPYTIDNTYTRKAEGNTATCKGLEQISSSRFKVLNQQVATTFPSYNTYASSYSSLTASIEVEFEDGNTGSAETSITYRLPDGTSENVLSKYDTKKIVVRANKNSRGYGGDVVASDERQLFNRSHEYSGMGTTFIDSTIIFLISSPYSSVTIQQWEPTWLDSYISGNSGLPAYRFSHFEMGGKIFHPGDEITASDLSSIAVGEQIVMEAVYDYLISYNHSTSSAITGIPESEYKTHGVDYTLSSSVPRYTDYHQMTFDYWYEVGRSYRHFLPNQVYTDDEPLGLSAEFRQSSRAPYITNATIRRCDENGNQLSYGRYCKVSALVQIHITYDPTNTLASASGVLFGDDVFVRDFTCSVSSTETSSSYINYTVTAIMPVSRFKSYWFRLTATDTSTDVGHENTVTTTRDGIYKLDTSYAPSVYNVSTYRCDAHDEYDYDGLYGMISVTYRSDTSDIGDNDCIVSGRYRPYGSSSSEYRPLSFTEISPLVDGAINSGWGIGTWSASTAEPISTSGAYEFEVTVTDSIDDDPNHTRTVTKGGILLGATLDRQFSFTIANGQSTVLLTGDLKYMGYYDGTVNEARYGENRVEDSVNAAHRVGVFNIGATLVSGAPCNISVVNLRNDTLEPTDTTDAGTPTRRLTDTESVLWQGCCMVLRIYHSLDNEAYSNLLGNEENGFIDLVVRLSDDWVNYTEYSGNIVVFSCPRYDESNARFVFYQPMYNVGSGSYVEINGTPVGVACPKDAKITLTGTHPTEHPTLQYMSFWHWNTASNNTGTTYNPTDEVTWSSLADKLVTIDGVSGMRLYSIWNPLIRYYRHSGTSVIPDDEPKHFNETYTIPATIPVRSGYVFLSYNTDREGNGVTYMPSGTIVANQNTSMILYPQWRRATKAPTINRLTAVRCDAYGHEDALGSYCKVTVGWSVDRTYDPDNNGTLTGILHGETDTPISFVSGAYGASGTASAIVADVSIELQYTVEAIVTDTNNELGHVSMTTRTVILTSANFVLDLRSGGTAMGIGSAAPQSGLRVGWDTQIDGDLNVLGNLTVRTIGSESADDIVNPDVDFEVEFAYGYVFGPVRTVYLCISNDNLLYDGSTYILGQLDQDWRPPYQMGFSNQVGRGLVILGGTITFKPEESIQANSTIYIALTFISA